MIYPLFYKHMTGILTQHRQSYSTYLYSVTEKKIWQSMKMLNNILDDSFIDISFIINNRKINSVAASTYKSLSPPQFNPMGLRIDAVIWSSFDYYCSTGSELVFRIPKFKEKQYLILPVNTTSRNSKISSAPCSLPTLLQITWWQFVVTYTIYTLVLIKISISLFKRRWWSYTCSIPHLLYKEI